ncbi:MAG TPA: alanine--tRNA ligase [Bacteroidota bacterium]
MTSAEIRNSFLKFFEDRGHTIVPSSPVVPYDDPTLLFTNAGMNQFKDVFLGTGKRSYARAADTQKCIRVSGKHNDLEEVGRDTYHHTFFEMLGNWSFGDYYKKEAIGWAWELLTKVWGLPKNRLWATVYNDDDEAERYWKSVTDIDPAHVLRFGEKENFWEMGETGPCGPCSEIHIDRTPNGTATADLVNAGVASVMEIWNLVFIQYNRDEAGTLTPLPAKHVDTGMGFERVCAVLQGKDSNYDTDVFTPLINQIAAITGKPYNGSLKPDLDAQQSEIDTAMRVVADHIRTLTFAIGDGALPSNEGRGYVLRRILRRAARFGRNLDMREPFIYRLVPTLVESMSYIFPEIRSNQEQIQKVIKGEEEGFNATLDRGLEIFASVVKEIGHSKSFPGEDAFRLYDTFGFPLDLTQLMAEERGLKVDVGRFTELMDAQRTRARDSGKANRIGTISVVMDRTGDFTDSEFIGYTKLEDDVLLDRVIENYVSLDRTPFYVESGGQVSDTGVLEGKDFVAQVISSMKKDKKLIHEVRVVKGSALSALGTRVRARVDSTRRHNIERNHSATHLVHEALRQVLGNHLHQQGSLVAPEYLRFDFNHFEKIAPDQLKAIEDIVNDKIAQSIPVNALNDTRDWLTIDEAKRRYPNVKMFFGDKYGDRVRIVEIDPKFSVELCGGTHVVSTREIGFFKFKSEGSIASGIRRIEAVTGDFALELLHLEEKSLVERIDYARQQVERIEHLLAEAQGVDTKALSNGSSLLPAFSQTLDQLKSSLDRPGKVSPELRTFFDRQAVIGRELEELILRMSEMIKSLEKEAGRHRMLSLTSNIEGLVGNAVVVDGFKLVAARVRTTSVDELKTLGDSLRARIGSGVGLLASVIDEKVSLVCVVTDDLIAGKKIEAGKVVGAVAKLVGGGGGGRPHMATAGGKDVAKLDEAIAKTKSIVESFLHRQP